MEAAGRLFAEHGYDGTRLDQVAAAAGVTKPVLYRHFADKTALYLALLERHRDDLASFEAAIPETGTLEERLRAVVEVWLDYVESHAYAWRMLFRDRGGGPEIHATRLEVHDRARVTLEALIRGLSVEPIPPPRSSRWPSCSAWARRRWSCGGWTTPPPRAPRSSTRSCACGTAC